MVPSKRTGVTSTSRSLTLVALQRGVIKLLDPLPPFRFMAPLALQLPQQPRFRQLPVAHHRVA